MKKHSKITLKWCIMWSPIGDEKTPNTIVLWSPIEVIYVGDASGLVHTIHLKHFQQKIQMLLTL